MTVAWRRWLRHAPLQFGSRWRQLPRAFVTSALGIVFPPICLLCEQVFEPLEDALAVCGSCRNGLAGAAKVSCRRCARPLAEGLAPLSNGCGACRGKPLRFDRALALGVYCDQLRDAVLRLKQANNDALAFTVGRLLAAACRDAGLDRDVDLVVPVPVHWRRRLARGGHPPELLVEAMAGYLAKPAARRLVRCRRKTRKQATLLPTQRRSNVRRAYQVSRGYDIKAAHILVVDDVMTTGATMNEVARTLRRAGATRVSVAVVARGIGYD